MAAGPAQRDAAAGSGRAGASASRGGTYVLVLDNPKPCRLRIGRLGEAEFAPGQHLYVGSAFGPGGLAARLAHHARPAPRPHWHIDHVRAAMSLRAVLAAHGRFEHAWAAALGQRPVCHVPLPRLGASDCRCETHLFALRAPRAPATVAGWLRDVTGRQPVLRLR